VSSSNLIESPFCGLGEGERNLSNAQSSTDARSYLPPVPIDGVMRGTVIGKVVATKSSDFSVGEYVSANSGWAEVAIVKEKELQKLEVPANGKVTDGLGVLGTCRGPQLAPKRTDLPMSGAYRVGGTYWHCSRRIDRFDGILWAPRCWEGQGW